MQPELTWGTTQKGQKLIIFNGNEFTKKLATKTTTHWRCSKWRSHSCKATIVTCADRMLSSKNDGLVGTTNAVEGWHLGVTALFHGSHPPVPTFLAKIKLDSFNQKFNFLKAATGTVNKGLKKYREIDEKFFRLVNDYNPDAPLNFLMAIAHLTHS